jgi:hypothetical protein
VACSAPDSPARRHFGRDRVGRRARCDRGQRAGAQRGGLEDGRADCSRVVAGVVGLAACLGEVARHQRGQAEREPEADPVWRRLGGQRAERDVQAAASVLDLPQPPLGVGDADRQREAVLRRGGLERAQQRVARAEGVARRRLGVGELRARRGPARVAVGE